MGSRAGWLPSTPYVAIPTEIVVLQHFHRPQRWYQWFLFWRASLMCAGAFLIFFSIAYTLFPSDPKLQISRLSLSKIKINTSPSVTVDLSFSLLVKVRNPDFLSADYDSLKVSIGYRGRELGFVNSTGGKVKSRGSSYIPAQLDLDGIKVARDAIFLIQDVARGIIPFETITSIKGHMGLLFLHLPVKAKVACEVQVNVIDQTVVEQNCFPELLLNPISVT